MHWYDRAMEALEGCLDRGEISYEDFRDGMRELNAELRQAQQDCADEAYDNYY